MKNAVAGLILVFATVVGWTALAQPLAEHDRAYARASELDGGAAQPENDQPLSVVVGAMIESRIGGWPRPGFNRTPEQMALLDRFTKPAFVARSGELRSVYAKVLADEFSAGELEALNSTRLAEVIKIPRERDEAVMHHIIKSLQAWVDDVVDTALAGHEDELRNARLDVRGKPL